MCLLNPKVHGLNYTNYCHKYLLTGTQENTAFACNLSDGRKVPAGENFEVFHKGEHLICLCHQNIDEANGEGTISCRKATDPQPDGSKPSDVCKLPDGSEIEVGKEHPYTYRDRQLICVCPSPQATQLKCRDANVEPGKTY